MSKDKDRNRPTQQNPDYRNPAPQTQAPPPMQPIGQIDVATINAMEVAELRRLAAANNLPTDGNGDDLRRRLVGLKLGGDKKHIWGKTICPSCGNAVVVTHTQAGQYRRIRCPSCTYTGKLPW